MPKAKNDVQDVSINDYQQNISVKIIVYFNILKQSILDFFWELPWSYFWDNALIHWHADSRSRKTTEVTVQSPTRWRFHNPMFQGRNTFTLETLAAATSAATLILYMVRYKCSHMKHKRQPLRQVAQHRKCVALPHRWQTRTLATLSGTYVTRH